MSYVDGVLIDTKTAKRRGHDPVGNSGTTITVSFSLLLDKGPILTGLVMIEDLFYNTPTCLSAYAVLRSTRASLDLDIMTKHVVHNPKVAFMCKKVGFTTIKNAGEFQPTQVFEIGSY